jgi:hypothetical protein
VVVTSTLGFASVLALELVFALEPLHEAKNIENMIAETAKTTNLNDFI